MGSCCGNDAPTPPNPLVTAAAQTGSNVSTAVANSYLNNMNQNTPSGSLTYDVTGNYSWTDPTTGSNYSIPRFTSTQNLTPAQQDIYNNNQASQFNLSQTGREQSYNIRNMLNTPFNPTAYAPAGGNASGIGHIPAAATSFYGGGPVQTSLGNYGQQQSTFGDAGQQQTSFDNSGLANAGNITNTYGPGDNFSADRQNVQNALMARINPQLATQQDQLRQQLADQGIQYGSQAYNNAFTPYNQMANDARFSAISQAGQEQQRMNQMAQQLGQFQNAAQQQAYGQAQGRGQFANAAQQAAYQQAQGRGQFANDAQQLAYAQALGAGSFANQAIGQQFGQNAQMATFGNAGLAQQQAQQQAAFNASQTARNQYMQEQYQQRNQPMNEISALMSGSQLQQPNWLNTPTSQIPTTDVAGLINTNFNQQASNYQQQNQNYQTLMGGILGMGAGYLRSDRREKENITPMGSIWTTDVDHDEPPRAALPIYQYSYKDDPASARHIGPMAQDVEQIDRGAVVKDSDGTRYIDRARVMGGILRAA